jgi:hypothetical protein
MVDTLEAPEAAVDTATVRPVEAPTTAAPVSDSTIAVVDTSPKAEPPFPEVLSS